MKHRLLFKVTGSNSLGADTGTLTLFKGEQAVMRSSVFSGGGEEPDSRLLPIPSGTFRIRLDIRKIVSAYAPEDGDIPTAIHHWYGIEKIDSVGWQWEWGHYRAALNETSPHLPQGYRGNFLHGKLRPKDWTHGCICERNEQILRHLWSFPPERIDVKVER